ncbi:hypothetical protein EJB05_14674 [Eragrostis curvula]|uniref:Cell differentiation protein rcd1 n=1 Tax=Eragrostis curvula TaxID=38414 RepID=A0A5J9VZU3_9POAL|nr:hypothetical protein EJB05_14674 [Eragrostis curvula]
MNLEEQLVLDLADPELRGNALVELSKKRETFQDLAVLLWCSYGTMAVLLQELLAAYPYGAPLSSSASNRACNVLALLQTVASHQETRIQFVRAHFPAYLEPFLSCAYQGTAFESLRLTTLGVLGALVKDDDAEVIILLLQSEVIALCLKIMEMGNETPKMVATYIIQKIMLNDAGLTFFCATADRFFNVASVLATMVHALVEKPSTKVLKLVIRCYLRLTYNNKALVVLRLTIPEALKDGTFDNCLRDDHATVQCLQQLLHRLNDDGPGGAPLPVPDPAAGGRGSAWQGAPPPGPSAAGRGAFLPEQV